jgi:hypothetical protein
MFISLVEMLHVSWDRKVPYHMVPGIWGRHIFLYHMEPVAKGPIFFACGAKNEKTSAGGGGGGWGAQTVVAFWVLHFK